jgi:hypothetical protein
LYFFYGSKFNILYAISSDIVGGDKVALFITFVKYLLKKSYLSFYESNIISSITFILLWKLWGSFFYKLSVSFAKEIGDRLGKNFCIISKKLI